MKPQEQLTTWVSLKHQGQLIRGTDQPYFNHLKTVAALAGPVAELGYEIGLCHDLLEDTDTTEAELISALFSFGYNNAQSHLIAKCVIELTDVFTARAYPDLGKAERKERESARLATISATAQTVKYADLIDNINWVLAYDQKHAEKYFKKKQLLLENLNKGDDSLRQQAFNAIHLGMMFLKERANI